MTEQNQKVQQYLTALMTARPNLITQIGRLTEMAVQIVAIGDDVLDLPATADNVATFILALTKMGMEAQKAELAEQLGAENPAYTQAVTFLENTIAQSTEKLRNLAIQATNLAKEEDLNDGAIMAALIAEKSTVAYTITKTGPKTVWEIILAAPLFFFKQ